MFFENARCIATGASSGYHFRKQPAHHSLECMQRSDHLLSCCFTWIFNGVSGIFEINSMRRVLMKLICREHFYKVILTLTEVIIGGDLE